MTALPFRVRRLVSCCLAFAAALAASPAGAIVQGREGGPLAAASLMVLNARGGVCSGLVLAPDVILTAGHCVAGGVEIRVHYRESDGRPALLPIAGATVHPEYRADAAARRQRSVDLALVRLAAPLAGFARAELSAALPRAGAEVVVAGFGATVESDPRTMSALRSARLTVIEPYGPSRILLWAADPAGKGRSPGAGACNGDSGGAMVDAQGGVVAVTSWSTGPGKSRCGLLTQGVLIGPQRPWIDATLAGWGRTALWFTNP